MSDGNTEARVIADVQAAARLLPPGGRLPSVRELSARHRASPVTVQRAISRLAAEGLVEPRPGIGTFVPQRPSAPVLLDSADLTWQEVALGPGRAPSGPLERLLALPPENTIPLSSGYLEPALQPTAALQSALTRAARRPGAWDRVDVAGLPELRAWFARAIDPALTGSDVIVCSGGQAAINTTLRALTVPGDVLLVESPTYVGVLAAAAAAGLRTQPVPADQHGVRPDLLADALRRTGSRLAYLQPLYANPHGATLAAERRAPVLEAVRAAGAFLIEDDWARDMPIEPDQPPPLLREDPDGHVVLLRSLTKVAAPGLRVAAIAARGAAATRLRGMRHVDDFFVSGPLQHAALELVGSPAWRRHLGRLSRELRLRRDALRAAVQSELPRLEVPVVPRGGLHLWARLPEGCDDVALTAAALSAGVVVSPGRPAFAGEPAGAFLRLTYAGCDPAQLAEGARRLADVMP